jgi:hypothetical protein
MPWSLRTSISGGGIPATPVPAPAEVAAIFDLNRYFRHVDTIFARVFGK